MPPTPELTMSNCNALNMGGMSCSMQKYLRQATINKEFHVKNKDKESTGANFKKATWRTLNQIRTGVTAVRHNSQTGPGHVQIYFLPHHKLKTGPARRKPQSTWLRPFVDKKSFEIRPRPETKNNWKEEESEGTFRTARRISNVVRRPNNAG